MKLRRSVVVLALLFVPVLGCKKLLNRGGDDAADAAPVASASVAAAADAAVPADTASAPPSTAADEIFTPPGACVDARKDAEKRNPSAARTTEFNLDLDGDGKADKELRMDPSGFDNPAAPIAIYIMRGTCGVFVGQVTANSVRLSGSKSHGLKSIEAFTSNNGCTDDCICKDQTLAFFFNGKTYQSSGKPKDAPRKCVDGGASPGVGTRGAVCKLRGDCQTGLECVTISKNKGKATCELGCTKGSGCGDDERCLMSNGGGPTQRQVCVHADCLAGEVLVDSSGDHECVKVCKKDSDCDQSSRPHQCQTGDTQLKPRRPVSTCFPR